MKRSFLNVMRAVAAGGLLVQSIALASPAHADGDGYIDNWPGNVAVKYAHRNATGQYDIAPLPVFPPSLSQTLDANWATKHDYVCGLIKTQVSTSNWRACDIPSRGELRAKLLGTNLLGLKYIVPGVHIRFDQTTDSIFGSYADPTIDANFDIEIDVSIQSQDAVDGAVNPSAVEYRGAPLSLQSAQAHLNNSHVSTANLAANVLNLFTNEIGQAENEMNQKSLSLSADLLDGPIGDSNAQLHSGAAQLGAQMKASEPTSNLFFNFDVSLDGQLGHLVLQFRRDYDPPLAPVNLQVANVVNADQVTWNPGGLFCFRVSCPSTRPVLYYEVQRMDYVWQQGAWDVAGDTHATSFLDHAPGIMAYGVGYAYTVSAANLYGWATSAQAGDPGQWPGAGGGTSGNPVHHCNPCSK